MRSVAEAVDAPEMPVCSKEVEPEQPCGVVTVTLTSSERRLACILERDAIKWLKPAKGQFQMSYRDGADQREYVPDFVAETETTIYMLEPKAKTELDDPIVHAKKTVAETWCQNASDYNAKHGGKPWKYALIPHDIIADNMTLEGMGEL